MKFLIIRTDRIGDLILSVPTIKALKYYFKDDQIDFLVSQETAELISEMSDIRKIYKLQRDLKNYNEILADIKKENYTHSIILMNDKHASWLPLKAGIPVRIGPFSKLSSFIKFNSGIFQHRSYSIKNEAEYNLDLLKKVGIDYKKIPIEKIKPKLTVNFDKNGFGKKLSSPFGIIHPGMGGSAENISKEKYLDIAMGLQNLIPVYMTFGPQDMKLYDYFAHNFPRERLLRDLSLKNLVEILSKSKFFLGPSTGPMHISAALGVKVFAIFSPIKVQSITRWGPWGSDATYFIPEVNCKEKYNCNKKCRFLGCIEKVSSANIISEIRKYMAI